MNTQDLLDFIRNLAPGAYVANKFPVASTFPDDVTKVTLTGGFPTDQWTGKKQPTFQVQVRAKNPADAEAHANVLHSALTNRREARIGAASVVIIRAMNSTPIYIGDDDNDRAIYTMNYECVVRP